MGTHQTIISSNKNHVKEGIMGNKEGIIGVLDVFIHHAIEIPNICIYHKQDVYAKVFLTSDPKSTEPTRTIIEGGQNPVFNENLRINVRNGDSSLRCEIWMLSRIKNYLEDQLLGFTLVPLCEILVENGKLEKEYELSTTELSYSPSGFVKLSIIYTGSHPDVLEIPTPQRLCNQDSDESHQVPCELEKVEFSDPNIINENEIMVSEYYTCGEIESHSVVNSQTIENDATLSSDSNDHCISKFPKENLEVISAITPSNDSGSSEKNKEKSQSSVDLIKSEPEQKTMQQEIVDMYLKSMHQFTDALANMNLPTDKGNESPDSGVNDSQESNGKKSRGPCPKVLYGSRAFF